MDRIDRISEEVRRELSDIIQNDVKDPRLPEFVSVTGVRVVKDLKHAKVYISVLGTPEQKQEAIKALIHAAGFIRREIGHRVRIRYTPELHFELDDSIEHGIRINQLISETMSRQPAPAHETDAAAEGETGTASDTGTEADLDSDMEAEVETDSEA